MDPKALASLDPKLRETYEKVMGTSTSPSPKTPDPVDSTPPSRTSTLLPGLLKPQTPPIPAPSASYSPNIPPPASPLNSTSPTPPLQSPVQASDFAALQPTPTGAPLPATQGSMQNVKTIQPLPSPASINKTVASSSQTSPVIRTLYIIASIIFFTVYTIFWLKIFKFPIPFLPF